MTNRITEKQLFAVCERINRTMGTPLAPYARNADNQIVPQGNAYLIDMAYGGYSLHQMMPTGTGERDVFGCGHVTKRDLIGRMFAFLAGVEDKSVQS